MFEVGFLVRKGRWGFFIDLFFCYDFIKVFGSVFFGFFLNFVRKEERFLEFVAEARVGSGVG